MAPPGGSAHAEGALATLRHGFKCHGRTLRIAFFKAAHELNPELEARYAANRLGLTRQLRFSPRSEQSLDVTPESERNPDRHARAGTRDPGRSLVPVRIPGHWHQKRKDRARRSSRAEFGVTLGK